MADASKLRGQRSTQVFLLEAVRLIALVALVGTIAVILWVRAEVHLQPAPVFTKVLPPPPPGTPPADCGPSTPSGRPIIIEMLYSAEKQAWIEQAADQFARRCPNIQIRLSVAGDIAGAEAILSGAARPTLWSPNDTIVADYLTSRWAARSKEPPFVGEPVSLVRSPLVLLMWEDRRRVFGEIRQRTAANEGMWSQLMCAFIPPEPPVDLVAVKDRIPGKWSGWYDKVVLAPARIVAEPEPEPKPEAVTRPVRPKRGAPPPPPPPPPAPPAEPPEAVYTAPFPSLETIAGWGHVKIGHASPTHTAAGLEVVYLMGFDRVLPPDQRPTVDDLPSDGFPEGPVLTASHLAKPAAAAAAAQNDALQRWFARCEGGLEADPQSVRLLTETMFHVGSERYDGVATYEHLVFPILDVLAGHIDEMTDLTVVYPSMTFVNNHPAFLLGSAGEVQTIAARLWLAFLREETMQRRAIEHGFRPANPAVKIRDHLDDANPFLRSRRFGIQFLQPITEPPRLGGDSVNLLLEIWRDATGRS